MRKSQRPRQTPAQRAVRFITEQNRLLQQDNTALIGMVKRLRQQLDELRAPKPKPKTEKAEKADKAGDKPARKRAKVHV